MSELLNRLKQDGVVTLSGHDVPDDRIQRWLAGAKASLKAPTSSGWDSIDFDFPKKQFKGVPSWLLEATAVAEKSAALALGPCPLISNAQIAVVSRGFQRTKQLWHVDDVELSLTNCLTGYFPLFQLMVGIPLIDLQEAGRGNLAVELGGHIRICNELQEARQGGASMRQALQDLSKSFFTRKASLTSLRLRVGQPFLMHALAPHGITPNEYESRYMLYFRFGKFPKAFHLWSDPQDMVLGFSSDLSC